MSDWVHIPSEWIEDLCKQLFLSAFFAISAFQLRIFRSYP